MNKDTKAKRKCPKIYFDVIAYNGWTLGNDTRTINLGSFSIDENLLDEPTSICILTYIKNNYLKFFDFNTHDKNIEFTIEKHASMNRFKYDRLRCSYMTEYTEKVCSMYLIVSNIHQI